MFNFIFYNKKNLFLFLGLAVMIIILALISMFSETNDKTENRTFPLLSPSATPLGFTSSPLSPTSSQAPAPQVTTPYDVKSLKADFERITSPQPLALSDSEIRNNLINQLGNQSGILAKTTDYQIEYVKAPDSFMVELNASDPNAAKLAASNWFKQQGLSVQGICNLPVVFYLSSETMAYYRQTGLKFNPIPEGCQ